MMEWHLLLEKAIHLAVEAHFHQKDKAGNPYIEHPIYVMNSVDDIREKIVAILHDVVEDTDYSLDQLRSLGFPEEIVEAVDAISKRVGETTHEYLDRVKVNTLALAVKKADMRHNSKFERLTYLPKEKAVHLFSKYYDAYNYLTEDENVLSNITVGSKN